MYFVAQTTGGVCFGIGGTKYLSEFSESEGCKNGGAKKHGKK
jgi:hypothetical protein